MINYMINNMDKINTYEAKKNFSALLQRVQHGESIVISNHNKPIAELVPIRTKEQKKRPFGLCKGDFEVPESFFENLPDEILKTFEPS